MTIKQFRDMLLSLGVPVYHNQGFEETGKFIRWAETSTDGYRADDRRPIKVHRIRVDFFTPTEYDPLPDEIEKTFERSGVFFDGPVISYETEDDVKDYHYIYDCEVANGGI